MKFKAPYQGEYDPINQTLKVFGKTTAGNSSEVVLPISDPNEFMTWLAACFREKATNEGTLGGVLTTNSISFSMHPVTDGVTALLVKVDVGGMPLSFAMPARNLTAEQIETIGHHLMTGMSILEKADNQPFEN